MARDEPRGTEPFVRGERLKDCKLLCAVRSNCRRFVEVDIERSRSPHILMVVAAHATGEAGKLRQSVAAALAD